MYKQLGAAFTCCALIGTFAFSASGVHAASSNAQKVATTRTANPCPLAKSYAKNAGIPNSASDSANSNPARGATTDADASTVANQDATSDSNSTTGQSSNAEKMTASDSANTDTKNVGTTDSASNVTGNATTSGSATDSANTNAKNVGA